VDVLLNDNIYWSIYRQGGEQTAVIFLLELFSRFIFLAGK
jgi:hypothetical protein